MKNFTFLAFAVVSLFSFSASAQQIQRCITEEKMQQVFQSDPQARVRYEATRRQLDEQVRKYLSNPGLRLNKTAAIVNIPVVVHIATSNPSQVTDAIVQSQIDTLNWYYGGAPANDSLRVYDPFRTVYGRSQIRFCLAQRTPAGLPTNGITRTTTSTTFNSGSAHPSTIVPAWNTQQYLNMWVVSFGNSGILGYSYKPGTWAPGDQRIGYVVDYRAFGAGASYLFPEYNHGKTAVHEIGHYFNLDHTWGPNNSGNPTCTLSDGCDDTPEVNGPFFGCVTAGPVTSTACASATNGAMWQNHMDYADDACMLLFTAQQVLRMETALNNAPDRNTLLTSNGCQPLVAGPNDAGITAIVTPASGSVFCSATVTPVVTLRNYGTNALTSVTITLTLNGTPQAPFSWVGNLSSGSSINVTLPNITLAAGSNTISVATSLPNGAADTQGSNDASPSATVTLASTGALPLTQGFEATGFPPVGWTRINPDGDFTWQRANVGRNSTASMWINNYDVDGTNHNDDMRSSPFSTAGVTTLNISFDVAHKNYGTSGLFWDTLSVLVSADCGATYQTVYKKWGPTLATAGSSTSSYTSPAATDWRNEQISVTGPILTGGQLIVVFRNTSRFGNNIFVDNINIQKQSERDLRLVSIDNPVSNVCTPTITPSVTVMNNGAETITGFEVGYRVDNGPVVNTAFPLQNLAPGASITVPLTQSGTVAAGNRNITAFTFNPSSVSGIGDVQTNNDTLSKAFTRQALANTPLVEGFETSVPPAGWQLINPNNNNTWVRRAPGRNSAYSAFIDNFNNSLNNQIDDLKAPYVSVSGADSLIMTFDLAHKNYPAAANSDTLTVLVSTDCGNTYTSVYKKWGATLATAGSSTSNYASPLPSDWRNERIALGGSFVASGNASVIIRLTNRFGNNVFVDNVNIATAYQRDVRVVSINQPGPVLCNGSVTPSATIKNVGIQTVTGVKVSYSVDNGAVQTTTLTGINLPRDAETTVNLTAANVAVGAHTIKVYTWDPVTATGTGDQYTFNDTLTKTFSVAGTTAAPLIEDFTSTGLPPANWSVVNADNSITWNRFSGGNRNPGSAYVNTYNYSVNGQKDDLVSPNVSFTGADSVKLTFDLAALTYSYPGSTNIPLDTLEVLVTKDCGNTFTTVYKKWGEDLQTLNDPNNTNLDEFFPQGANQWRNETVDLTAFGPDGPLMVVFRVTNNFENNIFIDNVNLSTRVLPSQLKQDGYLILPSPFTTSFGVWHLQTPTTLRYINVYNAAGQLVWTKQYNGNAEKMETIDMSNKAAGMYIVKLGYEDENRNVSQRVIKL